MTDKPRSIIMPNEPETQIVSPDKAIISPEEAALRVRSGGAKDGGSQGKHAISRKEAVSIAVQIGQDVYNQVRAEHALTMGQLQQDLKQHNAQMREIVALNILDLQRRSFSYRVRRDFAVDRQRISEWVIVRFEMARAWLAILLPNVFYGLPQAPHPPEAVQPEQQLPESPEVARAFTLSTNEPE